MKSKFSNSLLLSLIILAIGSAGLIVLFYLNQKKAETGNAVGTVDVNNLNYLAEHQTIEFGKPCYSPMPNEKGLQCYVYGDADNGENRWPGIWLYPDTYHYRPASYSAYSEVIKKWDRYTTPDERITFSYPNDWVVDASKWNENSGYRIITVKEKGYEPRSVSFIEIENNTVTIDKRVEDIKSNYSHMIQRDLAAGCYDPGSRCLQLYPFGNFEPTSFAIYIQKPTYYMESWYMNSDIVAYDYLPHAIISSVIAR